MLSGKLYLDGVYFDVHKQSHSFVEWLPQRQNNAEDALSGGERFDRLRCPAL
jgi:hypothetical protein